MVGWAGGGMSIWAILGSIIGVLGVVLFIVIRKSSKK
jgi:hypothetical protein